MGHPWDATMGGFNPNTPYNQYPDLGGIIMGSHNTAVNTGTTGVNGAAVDFANFKSATQAIYPAQVTTQPTKDNTRYFTFQLLSSLFGGSADKYIPMSAINGLRIVLTLEDPVECYTMTGMGSGVAQTAYTSTIYDPTLFLNMVKGDPTEGIEKYSKES